MNAKRHYITFAIVVIASLLLSSCGFFGHPNRIGAQSNQEAGEPSNRTGSPLNTSSTNDAGNEAEKNYFDGDEAQEELHNLVPSTQSQGAGEAGADLSGPSSPPAHPTQTAPHEEPEDMFFDDYGVNPFIDTEDDHFSTFALDVDTGSYSLARSYIRDGYFPPSDAVRVEEFINYFPQGYASPSFRDTFAIYMDGAATPFTETERYQVIRVGVQGYQVEEEDRKDVSLTFVIDVSGSMGNGNRLEMVKDSLALLVEQLGRGDRVSIVAYTDTAWLVLPPTPGNRNREIMEAIDSLYPMASTNVEAGLRLGYEQALEAFLPNGINRVVLCSDGVANVGNTGPESIWESVKYYAAEGITLTSVGVGMGNYNDTLMEQLADNGEGFYAYIDTLEEAERLFVHDLVSTLQVIALDAKIQVDFNPEVVSRYRLVGFENRAIADRDFRNDRVDAAEIGAGHSVTALYEVKLYAGARGEIATVYLRWQDPDTYRVHEIDETFYTNNLEDSFRLADPYFQLDVLVAEFAEILRDSYWAEDADLYDVAEYTESLYGLLEEPEVREFIELVEQANRISYHR